MQTLPNWLKWVIFVALALTWGSSFILMKRGLETFNFWYIGTLRIGFAALFTLTFAWKYIKTLQRKDILNLSLVGLFGNGIPYFLFPMAVAHISSATVGILNSLVPLFTMLVGLFFFNARIRWYNAIGIVLGFAGAAWLIAPNANFAGNQDLYWGIWPIIATVQYAISINIIGSKLQHLNSYAITMLSLFFVGVPALIWLAFSDLPHILATAPKGWSSLGYIAILGIVGSSLAIVLFNQLIKMTSGIFASSITYCVPIVAMGWGLVDGETLGINHLFGIMGILAGVYLVNKKKPITK